MAAVGQVIWGYRKQLNHRFCDFCFLAIITWTWNLGGWKTEEPCFDYRLGRDASLFPHSVRNGPRAQRGGVFLHSGREADNVTACQRTRGATPPLLDIPSWLIEYVGDFTVHWLEFGWWKLFFAESNAQTSVAERFDAHGVNSARWQSHLCAAFTAPLWNWRNNKKRS